MAMTTVTLLPYTTENYQPHSLMLFVIRLKRRYTLTFILTSEIKTADFNTELCQGNVNINVR